MLPRSESSRFVVTAPDVARLACTVPWLDGATLCVVLMVLLRCDQAYYGGSHGKPMNFESHRGWLFWLLSPDAIFF